MRVRQLELRLLALTLTTLWTLAALLLLLGYRPGGPLDLAVGLAAIPFVLIAAAGLAWPPLARPGTPFIVALALGAAAGLLLIPSIGGVIAQLRAGGPQTLLPSLEAIYPWALALLATAVFGGIGLARRLLGPEAPRRRRLLAGAVLGTTAALLAGAGFGAAAVANELALDGQSSSSSRYGPTRPGDPPPCTDPLVIPSSATFNGSLSGTVDRASIGQATLTGVRAGSDFRWQGQVASDVSLGRHGAARIGDDAWLAAPRQPWVAVPVVAVTGLDLDRRFVAIALSPDRTTIAQDLGLSTIGGALARHCRTATEGTTLREALPIVRWIVGDSDIGRWRGEIDYYVFLDGSMGVSTGAVNGEAFVLDRPGLIGMLTFELQVLDRGLPVVVEPPERSG